MFARCQLLLREPERLPQLYRHLGRVVWQRLLPRPVEENCLLCVVSKQARLLCLLLLSLSSKVLRQNAAGVVVLPERDRLAGIVWATRNALSSLPRCC